jgi:hypothetical protein
VEESVQLHNPAALFPGKKPSVPVEWEAGRTPEAVLTQWRREKFLLLPGIEPRSSNTQTSHCIPLPKQNIYMTLTPWSSFPWEANSQEILRLIKNQKVHYRVHKTPPLVPILSQMHPDHYLPSHSSKIHYNIILPSTPRFSEWSLPFRFSNKTLWLYWIRSRKADKGVVLQLVGVGRGANTSSL